MFAKYLNMARKIIYKVIICFPIHSRFCRHEGLIHSFEITRMSAISRDAKTTHDAFLWCIRKTHQNEERQTVNAHQENE